MSPAAWGLLGVVAGTVAMEVVLWFWRDPLFRWLDRQAARASWWLWRRR